MKSSKYPWIILLPSMSYVRQITFLKNEGQHCLRLICLWGLSPNLLGVLAWVAEYFWFMWELCCDRIWRQWEKKAINMLRTSSESLAQSMSICLIYVCVVVFVNIKDFSCRCARVILIKVQHFCPTMWTEWLAGKSLFVCILIRQYTCLGVWSCFYHSEWRN